MNASRVSPTSLIDVFKFLVQSVLVKLANDFLEIVGKKDPNYLETKIRRQFSVFDSHRSVSNPDGSQPPFVFNAAFDKSTSLIAW